MQLNRRKEIIFEENTMAMDKARMDAVVTFANTVLKYGRDTYGEKHTPLFADALDIDTMKPPEKIYLFKIRSGPRKGKPWQPLIPSDLGEQGNLMRFLVGLSNLTEDPRYKEAYKDCIRYHFEHYQTDSGLLNMGYHRFIDLRKDAYDGDGHPPGFAHELKLNFPYYDLFWATDPKAARKMIEGIWNCHMQNWSNLEFNRHAGYDRKLPENPWDHKFDERNRGGIQSGKYLSFYDTACDMIMAAGMLWKFSGNEEPLTWAKRLLGRYIYSAHPKTGLPPYEHTQLGDRAGQQDFPPNATEPTLLIPYFGAGGGPPNAIFAYGAVALMRLGDKLGKEGKFFTESVHDYLKAYALHAYNAEDNTLRPLLCDGTDMTGYVVKKGGYFGYAGKVYRSFKAHPGFLLSYALCYRQSKDKAIWDILRGICRGNNLGDIGEAGGEAPKLNLATRELDPDIIFGLVEIFRATDNRAYLDLARVVANNALKQRYNAEKGLFVMSDLHQIANLGTREPLAFITLQAALDGKLDKVPTYDQSNRFMWSRTEIMAGQSLLPGGWLRSPRALPYHPRASHHLPGITPTAACDEIIPENSQDNSVPLFTWSPHRGTDEWLEYTFDEPRTISSVEVYWFDDSGSGGGCSVPANWRVVYREAGEWKPMEATGDFGVAKDQFNEVRFKTVETDALRLEVKLQPDRGGGVLEWRVNR